MTFSDLRPIRRASPYRHMTIGEITAMIDPAAPHPGGQPPERPAPVEALRIDLSRLWAARDGAASSAHP